MQEKMNKKFNKEYLFLLLTIGFCLLGLIVITLTWIGFRNYPDGIFTIRGALLWLNEFPYLGTTHWELRHFFVLSMAMSILACGLNELSVLLPNIIAYLVILAVTLVLFFKNGLTVLGVIFGFVFLSVPIFAFSATTIFPEIIEFLLVYLSIVLFYRSILKKNTSWVAFFIAGILGGLAFTARETAVALVVFYFVLFLCNFGGKRYVYFIVAAGVFLPVFADFTYDYLQSDDPLYKVRIDMQQFHPGNEEKNLDFLAPVLPKQLNDTEYKERAKKPKLYRVGRRKSVIGHLSSFVTNHEYQAIFLFAVPALFYLFFNPPEKQWLRRFLLINYVLAISWFMTVIYLLNLDSLPRYLFPITFAAIIVTASAIYELICRKNYFIAYSVMAALLGFSLLSYDLQSEMLREERFLVEIAEKRKEIVFVPPHMQQVAKFFIQTKALSKWVDDSPPPSGALYLHSNNKEYMKRIPEQVRSLYSPEKSWEVLKTYESRTRFLGLILEQLGILEKIPKYFRKKIYQPDSVVTLYRVH